MTAAQLQLHTTGRNIISRPARLVYKEEGWLFNCSPVSCQIQIQRTLEPHLVLVPRCGIVVCEGSVLLGSVVALCVGILFNRTEGV